MFRLFVGRKYNPLRGGIDSCEYTNQELFVGTVAFTILLLLLPTTVMYYIVFTMVCILPLFISRCIPPTTRKAEGTLGRRVKLHSYFPNFRSIVSLPERKK